MSTRWDVEHAIRGSTLPAPARHILLTLATWTDHRTAAIPDRYTPSLTVLATATGLARSTVAKHLDALETAGWLVRTRPTVDAARRDHERTRYRLVVPVDNPPELVRQPDQASPAHGPGWSASRTELVRQPDTRHTENSQPVAVVPPCGQCGPGRLVELDSDRLARCPQCHPLRATA